MFRLNQVVSVKYIPRIRIAGSLNTYLFSFSRYNQFSKMVVPTYIPTVVYESSSFAKSLATFDIFCSFHFSHFDSQNDVFLWS